MSEPAEVVHIPRERPVESDGIYRPGDESWKRPANWPGKDDPTRAEARQRLADATVRDVVCDPRYRKS